jgi:hypothetical protein
MKRSHGKSLREEPDPRHLSDTALGCAIEACAESVHESDRHFARECAAELRRRRDARMNRDRVAA